MDRTKLKAVHDDDLEALLKNLGVYADFMHGRLKCAFCRDTIGWGNLHSLFPDSGSVKACCGKSECLPLLMDRLDELQQRGRRRTNR